MKALQHEGEIAEFVALLKREKIRSYLEIGSKFGGSLRMVAAVLPNGARIVSVDLPKGTKDWPTTQPALYGVIDVLNGYGFDAHVIWGDSTDPNVAEDVRALGPYDCVFIDANHTMPYVQKDWANYGAMSRKIVAFHDIAWDRGPDFNGYSQIDVPKFWKSLRTAYRHEEIKLDPTGRDNGIGVLWL